MTNIVKQICPLLGGADCAGMVALNHRNNHLSYHEKNWGVSLLICIIVHSSLKF